jgi:hypothetical protein
MSSGLIISANGNKGLQDNSGGGSGGSIWITAGAVSGTGNISVVGGNGSPFDGGGGGGGRLAIYSPNNNFTGTTNVNGGTGFTPASPGRFSTQTCLAISRLFPNHRRARS